MGRCHTYYPEDTINYDSMLMIYEPMLEKEEKGQQIQFEVEENKTHQI